MTIIRKISLPDTFRQIEVGKSVTFNASKVGAFVSARSAIYRLNATKEAQYTITTTDNGCSYTVTRVK